MDIVALAIALGGGAIGSHLAATRGRGHAEGRGGTILSGAMGGLIGSQMLERAIGPARFIEGDLGLSVVQFVGGAAGGAALLLIVYMLRALLHR